MYEAVEHSILPSTAAAQSSLAELLDFGPAETFVSHWWGSKVESTLEALEKHCEGHDTVRVWICSVANNQRRITEELGSDIDGSSFSQALHSKHCRAMALMLDDGCETLKRIWCLYEVLCVILMRDNHDHDQIPIEFDLCTSQGILNRGNLHTQAMEIGELVSAIDVAHAQCSNPQDKVLIDAAIQLHLGGHEQMNCRIREAVDQSLEKTQAAYYARIMRVRANLFTASGPDVSDHWRTAQDAVFLTHGTMHAGELLAKEREKNQQLEEENGRLREDMKRMRRDVAGNIKLREENAALKERLRRLQSETKNKVKCWS